MKLLLIILYSTLSTFTYAEVKVEAENKNNFGITDDFILGKFKAIEKSNFELLNKSLTNIESEINGFFKEKREQCVGIVKFVEVDEAGVEKEVSKELNADEKKLCLYELKKNQILFINELIKMKKKVFKLRYKETLSELDQLKQTMLKDVEMSFQKQNRKKK